MSDVGKRFLDLTIERHRQESTDDEHRRWLAMTGIDEEAWTEEDDRRRAQAMGFDAQAFVRDFMAREERLKGRNLRAEYIANLCAAIKGDGSSLTAKLFRGNE